MLDNNRSDKPADRPVLSTQEVCDQLDISKRTLQNWEKAGVIPRAKRDWRGYRVFNREDVERIREVIKRKAERNRLTHG